MAEINYVGQEALEALVAHIPQLVEGDNITLTPDENQPNKITISNENELLDRMTLIELSGAGESYSYLAFDEKELAYKGEVEALIDEKISEGGGSGGNSAFYYQNSEPTDPLSANTVWIG